LRKAERVLLSKHRQLEIKEACSVPRPAEKFYKNYLFTLSSPLFLPFNSMNLFVHFQYESMNGSTNGYYYLSAFEEYGTFKNSSCKVYQSEVPNKKFINKKSIKKIAVA